MQIHQLKAFLAVAKHGSFRKAALSLFRTQPTVTMAVQSLERDLGVKLLERLGRRNRLTAAGQALLEASAPLVQAWDALPARAREAETGTLQGAVTLGSGQAALLYLLPEPIRRFRKRHPGVELRIRNQRSAETLAQIRSGEIDLGFRALQGPPPAPLVFTPVKTFPRVLIAPRGHPLAGSAPITPEAIGRHPLILPDRESATRKIIDAMLAERGLTCGIAMETGGWETVKRYVALGLGVSVVPTCCLLPEDRKGLAIRQSDLFGKDTYGIVARTGNTMSRAAKALAEEIAILPP